MSKAVKGTPAQFQAVGKLMFDTHRLMHDAFELNGLKGEIKKKGLDNGKTKK